MEYTRKDLRGVTGLPDKTLRWLLDRLDIQPVDFRRTFFGSPIYVYDDTALTQLYDYIFQRRERKAEQSRGKRCRGGCNQYMDPDLLNSAQICDHCRRRQWLLNEATYRDPLGSAVDPEVLRDISEIVAELSAR